MSYYLPDYEPDYDAMWQEFVELDEQAIFYATHEREDYPMTDDHKPLPVAGYTAQPDAKVALVNRFKEMEERLLRELDALKHERIDAGGEAPPVLVATDYDHRWLAVARTHFQEGFMALNRAVFQPTRIKLPEDGE